MYPLAGVDAVSNIISMEFTESMLTDHFQFLSTLSTFVLMMLKNPDIQVKAQRELDSVLGHGQLPEYCDEESLPYLKAVVKESLRIEPPFPLGIAHMTSSQDVYRGYRIPAQTAVMPNVWYVSFCLHLPFLNSLAKQGQSCTTKISIRTHLFSGRSDS